MNTIVFAGFSNQIDGRNYTGRRDYAHQHQWMVDTSVHIQCERCGDWYRPEVCGDEMHCDKCLTPVSGR